MRSHFTFYHDSLFAWFLQLGMVLLSVLCIVVAAIPFWSQLALVLLCGIWMVGIAWQRQAGVEDFVLLLSVQCLYQQRLWQIVDLQVFVYGRLVVLCLCDGRHKRFVWLWPDQLSAPQRSELVFAIRQRITW